MTAGVDPVHNEIERRMGGDRREADALRMEWMQRINNDQRELNARIDEVIKNQDVARRQHEAMLQRLEMVSEVIGIDERGRHVRGGIAETFARLTGIKLALIWLAGGIIAVMGLYSTIKEVGQRWLGH